MEYCKCGSSEIFNKKRSLCQSCYNAYYNGIRKKEGFDSKLFPRQKKENYNEMVFIKNFFNHQNWIFEPCTFFFEDGNKYTPDFYDGEKNVFIEVAGTKQAFHANKHKYSKFKEEYPKINFEIRKSNGVIIEVENGRINWEEEV